MVFNTTSFLLFLAAVLSAYFLLGFGRNWKWQNLVLLVASYVSYGFWDKRFLALLAAVTVVNYVAGWAISRSAKAGDPINRRRLWLGLAIAFDLCVLGTFKYFNFFDESLVRVFSSFGLSIDPVSLNLDTDRAREAITERTRAILPVHLFGQPADMDEIQALAREFDLLVVEDCAQSFGARYREAMTGGIGEVAAFSFFPSKNLGCYGDGGMVTTNDDDIAAKVRQYRNHGSSQQYHHDVMGFNSRLDELKAVILRIKLKHIDSYNANRHTVAQTYNQLLADSRFETPALPQDRDHVFHQYTLLCDGRDAVREALLAEQIACAIYYPVPLHQQKAFADTEQPELPVTEATALRCLSLPVFPEMTREQIETVCEALLRQ